MLQQQAFTRAGNSPQPAHLLGSTEDERQKMLGLERAVGADRKQLSA